MGILNGIRVVDLAHHMAGPLCTQKLGDMGADVIKVEPPGGEWSRLRPINNIYVGDFNTSFLSLNRNKRSLTLNLKDSRARDILYRLLQDADVCIHNYRPEAARRLGVDYEAVVKVNPRLVYCQITGYGEAGTSVDRPGQDLLIQAYAGLTWNAGRTVDPPIAAGCFVADATTSYMALTGILAALLHRERTGEGQKVAVDLLSSTMDVQIQELTTYLNSGWNAPRSPEWLAHPMVNSPYGIHKTRDGYIALAMTPFELLADALECDALRQYSWDDGYKHREEIFRLVAVRLLDRTTSEWVEIFDREGVWSGPVNTYKELSEDANVAANHMIWEASDPENGKVRYVGFPIRFSQTPAALSRRPPRLSEHTTEVLGSIGIGPDEVQRLRAEGAV
jgi:crotonobetainyl-CoA:carnitine CoA-transferase CaiB-like acyl-CoA transferase